MKLSREKRLRFGIWNDYFVSGSLVDGDWKMREGYTEEKINNFFQSTKYRTYLDESTKMEIQQLLLCYSS